MEYRSCEQAFSADDPVFTTAELSSLFHLAEERGADSNKILHAAGILPEVLADKASKISPMQQHAAQDTAIRVCGDERILIQLAQRLHLTSYGFAGFALLSSKSAQEVIHVAEQYAPLLNLKFSLDLRIEGMVARLRFGERYEMNDYLRRSSAPMELAKVIVIMRDVLKECIRPLSASCCCGTPSELEALSKLMGIEVKQSTKVNEICFESTLLTTPLPQAHPKTHAVCREICDEQMMALTDRNDFARRVKNILANTKGVVRTLPEVASIMCVSQRTLRRRLEALGTSYNQILEDVRKDKAIRYLESTNFTTDTIADLLGYSDAANFRHAFKRWTGMPPRHYCAT